MTKQANFCRNGFSGW